MPIRFIDLFAGVGGFHYGLENVNALQKPRSQGDSQEALPGNGNRLESVLEESLSPESRPSSGNVDDESSQRKFTCVYSNEWDKYANAVYTRHFGKCDNRDIRTVPASDIPDFDLLCAGFPCQSFSIAGKRGGFSDTRGTMFFEIARIVKEKRPRLLLLENVKGLLSHEQGRTFGVILTTLDELGYDVQWSVLNSKNFGVPQNRERVLIVGHLRGTPRPEVFPLEGTNPKTLEYVGGILSEKSKLWLDDGKTYSRNFPQGSRVYKDSGISSSLASQAGGLGAKTGLYDVSRTVRAGGRGSIDGQHSWDIVDDGIQVRKLTPIECERLQGFPDNWTEYGVFLDKGFHIWRENLHELTPISDTQRYRMMGNAVTTNVITAIGERLQ